MLLEQLVEHHRQHPRYDWQAYYRWYFQQLNGQEFDQLEFWLCERCLRVNQVDKSAKYGTCSGCQTIHPRFSRRSPPVTEPT